MYSVIGFRHQGDFSILRNRDNYVSRFGNTDFPQLVGKIELFSKTLTMTYISPKLAISFDNKLSNR